MDKTLTHKYLFSLHKLIHIITCLIRTKCLRLNIYPRSVLHSTGLTIRQLHQIVTKCPLPLSTDYVTFYRRHHHHPTTPDSNKIYPPQFANHGCTLLFLWHSLQNKQRIIESPQILPCRYEMIFVRHLKTSGWFLMQSCTLYSLSCCNGF